MNNGSSNKKRQQFTSPVARNDEKNSEIWSQLGKIKKFKANTTIWGQGDKADYVYVIKNGSVRIDYTNFDGKTLCLYILSNGMLVGEGAVIRKSAHNYRCVTLGECELYCIPSNIFLSKLSESVKFSNLVLDQTMQKRLLLMRRFSRNSYGDTRQKLCHFIYDCGLPYVSSEGEEKNSVEISFFTHQVLSELLGISRVAISNCMKQLAREELIIQKRGKIHISDFSKLKEECVDFLHE